MAGNRNSGARRRVRIVEFNMICDSVSQAAAVIKGNQGSISQCINGKQQTHKGYHFEDPDKEKT